MVFPSRVNLEAGAAKTGLRGAGRAGEGCEQGIDEFFNSDSQGRPPGNFFEFFVSRILFFSFLSGNTSPPRSTFVLYLRKGEDEILLRP
jgi:hypothetical protein